MMMSPSSPPQEEKKENSTEPSPQIQTPTLRRNVSATVMENTTAVQRLVEYFVVVSCQPRWDEMTSSSSIPSPAPSPVSLQRPSTPDQKNRTKSTDRNQTLKERKLAEKLNEGTKRFGESIQNTFKKKEMSGTERAIQRTMSVDETVESREDTLSPPKPLGTWKREESEHANENIHFPNVASEKNTFQPKVTARFPVTDHSDNPLNPMITHFCHPVGDVISPSTECQTPKVHHFVLTNEMGRKVYGTCLTFYEEYDSIDGSQIKSKSLVHADSEQDIEVTVQNHGKEAKLYLPRCLCILSIWPYVTAFREYLAQLYRLATATDCMTAPIERYVMNICMEVPAPPPGAFEVQVNILDSVIRFWSPPAKLPIAYVALPYRTLFDCLDIETILLLWYCLTLERKVLLVSSQYSLLTVCSEILCSLLYPMKWSHLYVPILPRFLSPMLDAPVPYLCGVTRENWLHTQRFVCEETIVVDLDRNSLMFGERTEELPAMPGKKWMKLQSSLEEIAGHLFWKTRGLEKEYRDLTDEKITEWNFKRAARQRGEMKWNDKIDTYDQAYNLQYTPDCKKSLNKECIEQEQILWDKVQECFLRFFVAIFKHYREFLNNPETSTSSPTSSGTNEFLRWSKRRNFDRDGFLGSQNPLYLPYLSQLCATQQLDDFVTKRLYNPEMPEIIFFDQSIDAKLNRSRLKFSKVDTPFLQSAKTHKVLKSFVAVEPSVSDLPTEGPFVYRRWPEMFDPNLFSRPRPIPSIITAEFDRQASLFSKLRRHSSPVAKENDHELMFFYGSDFDMHPEGMAFTVYFFTYSAIIGREWKEYQKKTRELEMVGGQANIPPAEAMDLAQSQQANVVSDLTLGMLDDCNPEMRLASQIVDCIPCPQYADQLNSQAQEAYNVISKFAMNQFEMMNNRVGGSLLDDDEGLAEYEEARDVAVAQLDLAFDSLRVMGNRGFLSDPDIFRSLMEACSRCGDTKRALELIEMMKRDGVADKEVLACFMAAFCQSGGDGLGSVKNASGGRDAYSDLLRKKLEAVGGIPEAGAIHGGILSDSGSESGYSGMFSESSSISSETSESRRSSSLLGWLVPPSGGMSGLKKKKKKKKRKKKNIMLSKEWALTDRLSKQIMLGESLLDFLYPDLSLDTNADACPKCSHVMSENEIMNGWLPCEFEDYRTICPRCNHRFVPKFSVSCTAPTFEGSQGKGTPLFCEFLSPWVLRKELHHVIKMENGIDTILNPVWRSGTDIQATLWWNLIAMLQRHDLPYSYLLQGSFKNRLINPVPQD